MSIKSRIAAWYVARRLRKASGLTRKEWRHAMKPLPKWMGWLSMLGSVGALCTTLAGLLPPKYAVTIATIGTALASLSHSLPGTGGKPQ